MPNLISMIIGLFIAIILGIVLISVGMSVEDSGMVGLGMLLMVIAPALMVIGVIKGT